MLLGLGLLLAEPTPHELAPSSTPLSGLQLSSRTLCLAGLPIAISRILHSPYVHTSELLRVSSCVLFSSALAPCAINSNSCSPIPNTHLLPRASSHAHIHPPRSIVPPTSNILSCLCAAPRFLEGLFNSILLTWEPALAMITMFTVLHSA